MTNEFERDVLVADGLCSACLKALKAGTEVWMQASEEAHWDPNGFGVWFTLCDPCADAKMNGEIE